MATHAFPQIHVRRRRPGVLDRIADWWRGAAFDAVLAAGADPDSDARLAAHAARLARPHHMSALAEALERALEEAEHREPVISAAVPVRKSEVLGARDELLALAAALRTNEAPPARAPALSRRLLIGGDSPLFNPEAAGTLRGAVREALLAFGADNDTTSRAA
jgi:hypothetical protein